MVSSHTRDYTSLRSVPSLVGLATICSLMQNFPISPRGKGRIPTILPTGAAHFYHIPDKTRPVQVRSNPSKSFSYCLSSSFFCSTQILSRSRKEQFNQSTCNVRVCWEVKVKTSTSTLDRIRSRIAPVREGVQKARPSRSLGTVPFLFSLLTTVMQGFTW